MLCQAECFEALGFSTFDNFRRTPVAALVPVEEPGAAAAGAMFGGPPPPGETLFLVKL